MPEVFGFDDSSFVDALNKRGFDVATRSRSNYLLTALSLPSLLNMRHVGEMFTAQPGGDGTYRAMLRSFSADNAVFREMRSLGYQTTAIASGFEEVAVRAADRVIDTGELNEFELAMARETSVGRWVPRSPHVVQRQPAVSVRNASGVDRADSESSRTIVRCSRSPTSRRRTGRSCSVRQGQAVPAPPLDHFFDDNAHDLGLTPEAFGRRYVAQVDYLNGLVLDAVDDDPGRLAASAGHRPALGPRLGLAAGLG